MYHLCKNCFNLLHHQFHRKVLFYYSLNSSKNYLYNFFMKEYKIIHHAWSRHLPSVSNLLYLPVFVSYECNKLGLSFHKKFMLPLAALNSGRRQQTIDDDSFIADIFYKYIYNT